MSALELFSIRHSIRRFEATDVTDAQIQLLLQAAISAPSAGNLQPWHFYVVRDAGLRKALGKAAHDQPSFSTAPLVITVCAVPEKCAVKYGDRGRMLYCIQDTAAAIENLLLSAASQGLGACWCGAFDELAASAALALPEGHRPIAIIPIGVPAGEPRITRREPLTQVVTQI